MIEYIYIVKCPECDDEQFGFFDEAKDYAMSCLTKKPVITQTEINRNDFGECTDHCDLGTVWSWEDMMKDTEPEDMVFSKNETFGISEGIDDFDDFDIGPQIDEFETFDNSLDFDFEEDEIPEEPVEETLSKVQQDYLSRRKTMTKDEFAERLEAEDEILIFTGDPREAGIRGRDYFASKEDGKYVVSFWDETYEDDFTDSEVAEEFNNIDDLWAFMVNFMEDDDFNPEYNYLAEGCTKKPIPEGMTIKDLVEEMQENEDEVECTWCEELFDKSECRYEVNLGWLCSRCQSAIMSRGESLTFREGNYWDFLDEDIEKPVDEDLEWHTYKITFTTAGNPYKEHTANFTTWQSDVEYAWRMSNGNIPQVNIKNIELVENLNEEMSFKDLVKDSINHLTNDLGKDPWAEAFADDVCADLENNYDVQVPEDPEKYGEWFSAVASEVSRQLNNQDLTEAISPNETVDLDYDSLTIYLDKRIPSRDWREPDSWEEIEYTDSYTYEVSKDDVATFIWEELITEEDAADVPGGLTAINDSLDYNEVEWNKFFESHFDTLFDKYEKEILEHFEEDAKEDFQKNFTYEDYVYQCEAEEADRQRDAMRAFDESLEEASEYRAHLALCPECGTEQAFDHETGICISCGFTV